MLYSNNSLRILYFTKLYHIYKINKIIIIIKLTLVWNDIECSKFDSKFFIFVTRAQISELDEFKK